MKSIKNIVAIFILLITISTTYPVAATSTVKSNSDNATLLETICESKVTDNSIKNNTETSFLSRQNISKQENTKLLSNMAKKDYSSLKTHFAGSYIDNCGDLVVQVTEKNNNTLAQVKEITNNDKIEVNEVHFSYEELCNIYEQLNDKLTNKNNNAIIKNICDNIQSIVISQQNNAIIIQVKNLSNNFSEQFKEYICASNAIQFKKGNGSIVSSSTNMFLGNKIRIGNVGYYSIGCRASAKKNGKLIKGFLTAGHKVSLGDKVYYCVSSTKEVLIGKIVAKKTSGNVDCSFVQVTNANYLVNRRIKNSDGIIIRNDVSATPTEGEVVYKCGYAGRVTSGKNIGTKSTVTYSDCNITLHNLIMANYKTRMGDSGGTVYTLYDKVFAGIQSGVYGSKNSNNYYSTSYFVDQDYIFTNWGGLTELFLY